MPEGYIANISGLDRLTDALDGLAASVSESGKLRKVMEEMGMVLRRRTTQSFSQETAPEMVPDIGEAARAAGRAWEPLAESTARAFVTGTPGKRAARKKKRGEGYTKERGKRRGYANILQVTGTMKRTVVSVVSSDGKQVTVGTTSPYALFHAGGTKTMDARPFIGANKQDVDTMLNLVKRHLGEAME